MFKDALNLHLMSTLPASNQLSSNGQETVLSAGTRWLAAHLLDIVGLQGGPPRIRSVLPHPTDAPLGSGKDGSRLDPQAIPEQADLLGYIADVGQ